MERMDEPGADTTTRIVYDFSFTTTAGAYHFWGLTNIPEDIAHGILAGLRAAPSVKDAQVRQTVQHISTTSAPRTSSCRPDGGSPQETPYEHTHLQNPRQGRLGAAGARAHVELGSSC